MTIRFGKYSSEVVSLFGEKACAAILEEQADTEIDPYEPEEVSTQTLPQKPRIIRAIHSSEIPLAQWVHRT